MEEKRVADYLVVCGVSEKPSPPECFSDNTIKSTHQQAPITDITVIFPSEGEEPPPPPRSSHVMPPITPPTLTGSSRPPLSSTVSLPSGTGDTAGGAGGAGGVVGPGGAGGMSECVVCYERAVNCVLYNCGHMSLCYECARAQLLCSGICPICRATILDVIKIFKS